MNCSICHTNPHKYKCPACSMKTCSLTCVKRHKSQKNCSGVYEPSAYIAKSDVCPSDVNRDYHFLLQMGRKIDLGREDAHSGAVLSKRAKNSHQKLVKRNVNVLLLPKGMSRSQLNKSGYDKSKNAYFWTVEWRNVDRNFKVIGQYTSSKIEEISKPQQCCPFKEIGVEDEESAHFFFNSLESSCLSIIDKWQPLALSLKGKTVLEFPTIYVSSHDNFVGYTVEEHESVSSSESESSSESSSDSSSDEEPEEESSKKAEREDLPDEPSKISEQTFAEDTLRGEEDINMAEINSKQT